MKSKHQSITAVTLENFKAFGARISIPIKPLTVLSGLNSSGKSSIYQALLLLKQTGVGSDSHIADIHGNILPSLSLNGDFVQLGTPEDILHDRKKNTLTIGVRYSSGREVITSFGIPKHNETGFSANSINTMIMSDQNVAGEDAEYNYSVKSNGENFYVNATRYFKFLDYRILKIVEDWIVAQIKRSTVEFTNGGYAECIALPKTKRIHMMQDTLYMVQIAFEDVIKLLHPDLIEKVDKDACTVLVQSLEEQYPNGAIDLVVGKSLLERDFVLEAMKFIPPFRGFPERLYNNLERKCFVHAYEALCEKHTKYRYDNGTPIEGAFSEALDYWVGIFLGDDKKIRVESLMDGLVQAVYLVGDASNNISLNNLGFGVSQILPIVYECLSAGPGTLLVIDEPETHLHPSMQSKMADFLVQMARLGRNIIVETHSEYILDKLIYHCIRTPKARDVTELYWVTNDKDGSSVEPIAYDDLGYVSNAPNDFLSEKAKLVKELTDFRFAKLDAAEGDATI